MERNTDAVDQRITTRLVDGLRGLTAAAVLLSAVVHLDQYMQGFGEIPVIAELFVANVVAGLVLGIVVVIWRHWLPAALAAGFGAVTVVAYWVSVVWGLFGVQEGGGGWAEVLAEIAEYAAFGCGVAVAILLTVTGRHRSAPPTPDRSVTPDRLVTPPRPLDVTRV